MNKIKQFWTLLKFQLADNPFILLLPAVFIIATFCVDHLLGWNLPHRDDDPGFQNYFSSISNPCIILGIMWLIPTFMSGAADAKPFSIEFVLTRAVDRHLVYRARACLFYVIMLFIPLTILFVGRGNLLVENWHLWFSLVIVIIVPMLLFISHPLKHPLVRLFAFVIPLVAGGDLSSRKAFFFFFVSHQALFWILTVPVLILGQLWCERRFAQLEQ